MVALLVVAMLDALDLLLSSSGMKSGEAVRSYRKFVRIVIDWCTDG